MISNFRLYEIVGEDCTGLNLKHLRQISLRDVVRWCTRSAASINKGFILNILFIRGVGGERLDNEQT